MKYQLFLGILISMNFFLSCSKSETQRPLNPTLLDSAIMATSNLNFIYDSQNRVVRERLVGNDTLREENTYVYNGIDSSPYMRSHINHSSNLNFVSYFTYNSNGYKVRDSTYYFSSGSSIISVINYSITQKICVLQKSALNWRSDTIYLSSSNNIDSIRHFMNMQQPHGVLTYYGTTKFLQYNSLSNYFKSLSISRCNFYLPMPVENFGESIHQYLGYDFALTFDFLNQSYFTNLSTVSLGGGGITSNYQKQIQYNSDNLPIKETLLVGGTPYSQTRLVYR